MGKKAGTLLWNRLHQLLAPGFTTVDTGLTQGNKAFAGMSPGEPPLGVEAAPPGPPDGTLPASRVQVIPMSPISAWGAVTHGEPFVDPVTGTVKVTFNNATIVDEEPVSVTINVFFWDPHSMVGPGEADTYNSPPQI
jgi:hypothetical protein